MQINSPPRIKNLNVNHQISGCNILEVNGEGGVDGVPEVFCSACKKRQRRASSPHIEHIYGAEGTDWMELPRQKANLFERASCFAKKCDDSQKAHCRHTPYFPTEGGVRQLSLSEENLFLHEQIIEKTLFAWVESRTPALTGKCPSGLEGLVQYQHAFLDEELEKVHAAFDCKMKKGPGGDAHDQQLRNIRTFAVFVPLFGAVLWIVQATLYIPALESVNQSMLLIVVGLGLSVSQAVLFLTQKDIVVAIGCFVSVCCSFFSFFCALLVAGAPSWIGDHTFDDQSFQEIDWMACTVNLLLVVEATMLLLSSLCVRAALAERNRIASFDR